MTPTTTMNHSKHITSVRSLLVKVHVYVVYMDDVIDE